MTEELELGIAGGGAARMMKASRGEAGQGYQTRQNYKDIRYLTNAIIESDIYGTLHTLTEKSMFFEAPTGHLPRWSISWPIKKSL